MRGAAFPVHPTTLTTGMLARRALAAAPRSILIAGDDEATLVLLADVLRHDGCYVMTAHDAKTLADLLESRLADLDVLVFDDRTNDPVLRAVMRNARDAAKRIPIVLVEPRGKEAGKPAPLLHLQCPFSADDVRSAILIHSKRRW